jgi:two-component system, NarL family, response regulator NreC
VIRVLVVDDHALVRSGLRRVLDVDPGIVVEDEVGSAEQAVRMARLDKPDVVLLDIAMPGRSGLEVLAEISRAAPEAAILVLSMHDDSAYVREAFVQGASGYLLKEAAGEELLTAVREVAAGRRYLHPLLGARLVSGETDTEREAARLAAAIPLSGREQEVLRLLAAGHTNPQIAKTLFISVRTAETHRAHIMKKLRLTTRAELVHYALQHGLLTEEGTAA